MTMTPPLSELGPRFADLALAGLHRPYPSKVVHLLHSDDDARPPRALTPVFFGCFDWHSAVHGHWLLVRLLRLEACGDHEARARAALAESLEEPKLDAELRYLEAPGRAGFEMPYGMAWLLQLGAELAAWDDPSAQRFSTLISPLEELAARRVARYLERLPWPIRSGQHNQTAFSLGLALDAARERGHRRLEEAIQRRARAFYIADAGWPTRFEPGGHDFLSPGLGEADLMRRVLDPESFAPWLRALLPELASGALEPSASGAFTPVCSPDPSDGKLAHLDGLNLSRAFMLEGIASGLPEGDPLRGPLLACAARHAELGLAAVSAEHYAGAHWLGSFAAYLVTQRGLG